MLYFSEMLGRVVYSADYRQVGRLVDCAFIPATPPRVTKFIISPPNQDHLTISVENVTQFNGQIILKTKFKTSKLDSDEYLLSKSLLNKQIIDIGGRKVVRVNDVSMAVRKNDQIILAGVDTSIWGIWRWVKLEKIFSNFWKYTGGNTVPTVLTWNQIQLLDLGEGNIKLNTDRDKLENLPPEDLADYLEKTSIKNVISTLDSVGEEYRSEVIGELNLTYQVEVFEELTNSQASRIIALLPPDEAVDILLELSKYRRNKILSLLPSLKKADLMELMSLSTTNLGKYLNSDFLALPANMAVGAVINKVKATTSHFSALECVYFTSTSGKLIGVANLHELLLAKPDEIASSMMMDNLIICYPNTPLILAYKRMLKYHLSAIPVVDKSRHMLGIVTIDDLAQEVYLLSK